MTNGKIMDAKRLQRHASRTLMGTIALPAASHFTRETLSAPTNRLGSHIVFATK